MKKVIMFLAVVWPVLTMPVLVQSEEQTSPPLETVNWVDLDRYLGKWYEVARLPHKHQEGCVLATATYSLRPDKDIKVINECIQLSTGARKFAQGRAWVVDPHSQAKLKVQFFLPFVRIPFLTGNYWIIELDDLNYSYSVVSEPEKKLLWILSRNPQMEEATFNELLEKIRQKGLNLEKLIIERSRIVPTLN